MESQIMKKIMMFVALAVVPFLFNSCTSTSQEDVVYEIGITLDGESGFFGSQKGEAFALYNEISKGVSVTTEQWVESVVDGDSSAADARAIAKYDAVESQIKAKVAEYQTKVDALQDATGMFTISEKLYVRKMASGTPSKDLKSYKISFSYGSK